MAEYTRVTTRTATAAADMRTVRHHILRAAGAGTCNVASLANAGSDEIIGVLQNKPNINGAAAIGFSGESKVIAGAAILVNVPITANSSGRAVVATSGDFVVGTALEAASADGEAIRCLLRIPAVQLPTSLTV